MTDINLELKFVGNIKGNFYVSAYQRGYRWKEEVQKLLDDINEIAENENYCLQPIVVKNIGENEFELIDGQQRLTTIFLIFRYIQYFLPKNQIKFTIDYETRKNSRLFLEKIDFDNIDNQIKNIDEYFFVEAANKIVEWFNPKDKTQIAIDINSKLNKKIRIIWYEVNSDEDSVSLFTRLNIGRIPLTNSELVKALFLSRNNGIDNKKQLEIATVWDIIEKELHNDSLWYFITNENPNNYPTRIELIFNLIANKQKDEREKFFTFFYFDKKIKESHDKSEFWTDGILRYYQRLKEWYENIELYHKIGYLVASESKNLAELIFASKDVTKTDFQNSLDKLIAESINFKKDYCDLSYENPTDYDSIDKLLLLFNVETIRRKSDETVRFPFDKHKQKNDDWSLEHIHAQKSQGLNTKDLWIEWLELHKKSLLSIADKTDNILIQEIANAVNDENLNGEKFDVLFKKVTDILSETGSIEYTHSLSNMALLGKFDNAALNNSTFDVKRNKILEIDKEGNYIPVCTRRVFLKYYTPSESNQLHFWGEIDRKAYIHEMDRVLRNYLTIIQKEINL